MRRDAELAVQEEPDHSPFRSAALGLLGLATLLEGDPEQADDIFAETVQVGRADRRLPVRLPRPRRALADRDGAR